MKRSSNLRLVLMAAAVPTVLAGCESEPSGTVLASVEQCRGQTEIPLEECEAAYRTALAEHERLAPRFESQAQCNEQFGGCVPTTYNGQQSFIPPMAGFLIGYALGDLDYDRKKRRYYGVGGVSPLYRDYRSRDFLKPGGQYVSDRYGTVRGKYGNTALPTRAITVSRAGFGSSASARGGFGSSRGRGFGG